ncbi:MAG: zinc ribbon domain-containing protein, partial [Acutalibacteraceae bacterium]|nr:zinc ribbon domain-containing protein [Acutalibacteraceae bacterium]
MNCPKCGNPLAQDTKFCAKCGTPVPVAQPAVAAPVAPSQPVATPKAKKQKSNDGKKKNLGLKITAAVLVVAVLI